jgi:hypothetical protein
MQPGRSADHLAGIVDGRAVAFEMERRMIASDMAAIVDRPVCTRIREVNRRVVGARRPHHADGGHDIVVATGLNDFERIVHHARV